MRKSRFFHWCDEFLLETGRPIRAAGIGRRVNGWLIEWFLWFAVITFSAIINAAAGTPGKLMLGDQVIDTRGVPAGFWRMALRETIGKFVSGIVFGVGFYWIFSDKDQQGWHDKIAGTLVVTER